VSPPAPEPRPFLKWAGGKRQLLPALRRFYPARIRRFHEPFVGSGAVFFDLWQAGRLAGRPVVLTDVNADLVGCYLRVRDSVEDVLGALAHLAEGHERGGAAHYYDVRDARFNPARLAWQAAGGGVDAYPVELAAMLLYLNRTGFNGLFRLNRRGMYNVPAGRYVRPRIADAPLLRAVAAVLASPRVAVALAPFESVMGRARAGDLVYFDPPYAPLTSTASFRSYTAQGFSLEDQARLQRVAIALAAKDVGVLLSNSSAASVVALYEQDRAARAAGLRCYRVAARRAINSRGDRRGPVDELVVTNLPQGPDGRAVELQLDPLRKRTGRSN
jgi:DNA adenine methylase